MMGKGMKKNREQGRMRKINDALPKKQERKKARKGKEKTKKGEERKKEKERKKARRPNPSAVR